VKDRFNIEDRIIVTQRVVTVVIAKWSLRSSFMWRRMSDEGKLRLGCQTVSRLTQRISSELEFLSGQQRSKHELGDVFRQWRDRSED
jgi:hypothetical protein